MIDRIRSCLARFPRLVTVLRVMKGHRHVLVPPNSYPVSLDYPVHCTPRWGFGKPSHPELARIIDRQRARYAETLKGFVEFADALASVPMAHDPALPHEPNWVNGFLPDLDAIAIYGFLAARERNYYMEIGSGNSTKFARKAVKQHGRATRIVSVDPCPRAEIDALCDETIRTPLEDIDLSVFDRLGAGDVLFVDNSHRSFMNSDVTVFFLDILPRLRPGVLVGIHDVCLPDDYPPEWDTKFFSEQYLLACFLLAEPARLAIELPSWFVSHDPELSDVLAPLYARGALRHLKPHGCAFWLSIQG